ncbi:MAG: Na/Pi symporter [Myxococcota bacterium]
MADPTPEPAPASSVVEGVPRWVRAPVAVLLVYVFLVGVRGLSGGFALLGEDLIGQFFLATENPFVGLGVGLLATTAVQSSSATTSMIVALVAAPGDPLPMAHAIPMIMGANIGTTVTNSMVSIGHMGRPVEFRRAFAAATCHDFFNWAAVALLLPLELATGSLEKLSGSIARLVPAGVGGELPNPVGAAADWALDPLERLFMSFAPTPLVGALLFLAVAIVILFVGLLGLVRTLRSMMAARMARYLEHALGERPLTGMGVGALTTAMVQSSSITTSLMVPLAGTGILRLEQVFPIALGANLGTTLTALIASLGAPADTLHLAIQISLVHLFFNFFGIVLIYPLRAVRQVPLGLSRWIARVASRSKPLAFVYIVGLFYGLPAALVFLYRAA